MKYQAQHPIDLGAGFERIDECISNSEKNLEHLIEIDKRAKDNGKLLFRYFHLNVADGSVFYQITKITKKTATVTLCDGICLDNYADRFLGEESVIPIEKAMEMVGQREALESLFSR